MSEQTNEAEFIGEVDGTTVSVLSQMRRQITDLTAQIGQHEVSKARLIGSLQEIEARAQEILNREATRLGVPPGRQWQITSEGKARLIS